MNLKIVKPFMIGAISAYGLAALGLVVAANFGVLPVQADAIPSRLEAVVLGAALRASVTRHAMSVGNPLPPSEQNLIEGAKLYRQMCATCHGLSVESGNSYGQSFYPPAPNLLQRRTQYSDAQTFWIVKHGIRNTAMPAWGRLLSDGEIWQVVTALRGDR
jgi:mono/diheme cytochrome c family protein